MKSCPQCKSVFPDDYVFCLNDGTTLIDNEDNEQETIVKEKIVIPGESPSPSLDMVAVCATCGNANVINSNFCKKCGGLMQADVNPVTPPNLGQESSNSSDAQTIFFSKGEEIKNPTFQTTAAKNNQMKLIAAAAGVLVLVFVIFGMVNMSENKNDSSNSNYESTSKDSNSASDDSDDSDDSSDEKSDLPDSFDRTYQGTMGGFNTSMKLNRDGSKLSGAATTNRSNDTLEGTIENNGDFELKGYENGNSHTGLYKGKIDGNSMTGRWTTNYGTKGRSFNLTQQ